MKWASACSDKTPLPLAVEETAARVRSAIGDAPVDLAIVFVSPHHVTHLGTLYSLLAETLSPASFIGCTAGGVIGGGNEIEQRPGFSLTVASLPEVVLKPIHLNFQALPDEDAGPEDWRRAVGFAPENQPQFLILSDPFSFDPARLVAGLDFAFPSAKKVGGVASGASQPGQNALWINETIYDAGAIVLGMAGKIAVDTVVAQGCRPIGQVMRVTASAQNVILELDGKPAMEPLMQMLEGLNEPDKRLAQHALFVGVAMDEFQEDLQHGDYLIRNILGVDPKQKAIVVGEEMRNGRRVQFHLRDAATSAEDLVTMLHRYTTEHTGASPSGALLFSCLGRGEFLYGKPNHDTQLFEEQIGSIPLGGFFCNGEIGPVADTTHLHGYTSSFALFREP